MSTIAWIPTTQRVPVDRTPVLAWGTSVLTKGSRFLGTTKFNPDPKRPSFDNEGHWPSLLKVTHWAPIEGPSR
jgi:hypothetical protein